MTTITPTRPTTPPTQPTAQRLSPRTLLWVGPLTILACIVANLIVRAIAVAFAGVSAAFQPLRPPTIIGSSVVYLLLAIGVLALVSRVSAQPVRAYRLLASACLLVSLLFPLLALLGVLPLPGMNGHIFWAMLAMHLLSGALTITLLPLAIVRR